MFFDGQYCLIAEPSQSFSSNIHACLINIGVPAGSILVARKFEDALKITQEKRPKLIVTEYAFEKNFGLALVEMQKKIVQGDSLSILITKDSSDSVVAEAAEEQVDAFLIKPFSVGAFQEKLFSAIDAKLNPTPYIKKIGVGKELLAEQEFEKAAREFMEAKKLNEKPSLACYYTGRTLHLKEDLLKALAEYQEGRKYQPLHYKCLLGELELLIATKRYAEAYGLVPIIKKSFPITPLRLGQIFIATVFSSNFDAVGENYELFQRLQRRPPELTRMALTALLAAAKHFLEKKEFEKSVDLFEKSILVSGREFSLIEKIVLELLNAHAFSEAERAFSKVSASNVGTPEYNRLAFKIDSVVRPSEKVIEQGRKLVSEGQADPAIYRRMVKLAVESGRLPLAETVIAKALTTHPELRESLYGMLEKGKSKAA